MERFPLAVTRKQFDQLKALQVKKRWDWPATFSTNAKGEIWPYVSHGWTHPQDREEVSGLSKIVDEVARLYLRLRADGGRFFIDDFGAWHKSEQGNDVPNPFVYFQMTDYSRAGARSGPIWLEWRGAGPGFTD